MTSIEWFATQLYEKIEMKGNGNVIDDLLQQAKEMHKQEIIDAWDKGLDNFLETNESNIMSAEQYYQEAFVSKGSDERIVDTNKTITEISDESWEGCDGCTEQDEVIYKNGYVKGYNAAIGELPKEISDEEIEKAAAHYEPMVTRRAWVSACKWYREQLKNIDKKL